MESNEIETLLRRYPRSKNDVSRMKQRISDRQQKFKAQAEARKVSSAALHKQYDL